MGNRYIIALRKLKTCIDGLSKHYNKNFIYFWLDALGAYIKYGVTPNEYLGWKFYKLSSLERKEFFTKSHDDKYIPKFNDKRYAYLFDNKVEFNNRFKGYIKRDWLYTKNATEEQLMDFIKSHENIIVKPISASQGKGVHKLKLNIENPMSFLKDEYLLEEFIVQHHSISKINSSSVNTIRIYTLLHKDNSVLFLSASIRIGGNNAEVDNYHAGGVGYPIDIESGIICKAGTDINGKEYLCHPSTGEQVVGFKIPNWSQLKEFVTKACKEVPQGRMIAWDVVVLEDGFELLEGNYGGDPGFMQAPNKIGKKKVILKNL